MQIINFDSKIDLFFYDEVKDMRKFKIENAMKPQLLLFSLFSALTFVQFAQADILLGAPGVTAGTRIATKVPFKIDHQLSDAYKFVFSGIQAKGDTLGAPGSSGTNGNGGQFHLKASVSSSGGGSEKVGQIEFRNIQDYNTAPLKTILISPVAVFKASTAPIDIDITWQGGGNAHKPNGIFNVLGEYQKDPPIPTGSLTFATGQWILEDSPNPEGVAKVVRE